MLLQLDKNKYFRLVLWSESPVTKKKIKNSYSIESFIHKLAIATSHLDTAMRIRAGAIHSPIVLNNLHWITSLNNDFYPYNVVIIVDTFSVPHSVRVTEKCEVWEGEKESLCMRKALVGLMFYDSWEWFVSHLLSNSKANRCSSCWITCLTSTVNLLRLLRDCFMANRKVFPHYVPMSESEFKEPSGKSV